METKTDKKSILIVEDEVDLAQSYKEMFEQHGFSVHTTLNGVMALKYIQNHDVDVVICDLKLPQLEGDMFYVSVERTKPHLCDRFIIITAMADNPKFQPFITRMEGRVLLKPVPFEKLLEAVTKMAARTG
jgi:DNA-binding NtrC family response regulator